MDTQEIPVQPAANAAKLNPVAIVKERMGGQTVESVVAAFMKELPELYTQLKLWDGNLEQQDSSSAAQLVEVLVAIQQTVPKPVPWLLRPFKSPEKPTKLPPLTREAAAWKVTSGSLNGFGFVSLFIDVETGLTYLESTHHRSDYVVEFEEKMLLGGTYKEAAAILEGLRTHYAYITSRIESRAERQRMAEERRHREQAQAMEELRTRLGEPAENDTPNMADEAVRTCQD